MSNRYLLLLLIVFISVCVINDVNGLLCYDCNTLYDGKECAELKKDDRFSIHYKYCGPPNSQNITAYQKPLCRKIQQKIKTRDNLKIIKRSCGWELHDKIESDVCYSVRNMDHEETVCQCFEDACNNALIMNTNIFIVCFISFSIIF